MNSNFFKLSKLFEYLIQSLVIFKQSFVTFTKQNILNEQHRSFQTKAKIGYAENNLKSLTFVSNFFEMVITFASLSHMNKAHGQIRDLIASTCNNICKIKAVISQSINYKTNQTLDPFPETMLLPSSCYSVATKTFDSSIPYICSIQVSAVSQVSATFHITTLPHVSAALHTSAAFHVSATSQVSAVFHVFGGLYISAVPTILLQPRYMQHSIYLLYSMYLKHSIDLLHSLYQQHPMYLQYSMYLKHSVYLLYLIILQQPRYIQHSIYLCIPRIYTTPGISCIPHI